MLQCFRESIFEAPFFRNSLVDELALPFRDAEPGLVVIWTSWGVVVLCRVSDVGGCDWRCTEEEEANPKGGVTGSVPV